MCVCVCAQTARKPVRRGSKKSEKKKKKKRLDPFGRTRGAWKHLDEVSLDSAACRCRFSCAAKPTAASPAPTVGSHSSMAPIKSQYLPIFDGGTYQRRLDFALSLRATASPLAHTRLTAPTCCLAACARTRCREGAGR